MLFAIIISLLCLDFWGEQVLRAKLKVVIFYDYTVHFRYLYSIFYSFCFGQVSYNVYSDIVYIVILHQWFLIVDF